MKNWVLLLLTTVVFSFHVHSSGSGFAFGSSKDTVMLGADGPYVLYSGNKMRVVTVDGKGVIKEKLYPILSAPKKLTVQSEVGNHRFEVRLHPFSVSQSVYFQPSKLFVVSDPHGDFNSFVSILKAGKVINDKLEWTYGSSHLLVNGDAFDRGVDVLPILWLCYKLEQEALDAGGRMHFLIGNHESMVLSGDLRYMEPKYHALAKALNVEYNSLFSINSELGKWLRTKNYMEVIGRFLFVHAGVGDGFMEWNFSLSEVNETMRQFLGAKKMSLLALREDAYFLFGSDGPLWYRGLVRNEDRYNPVDESALQSMLSTYNVQCVVVGHTIFEEITLMHEGRVIATNLKNEDSRKAGKGRALLIEANKVYVVFDNGKTQLLKTY
jgi:hypothetical protein